jgi:hypothetical protein
VYGDQQAGVRAVAGFRRTISLTVHDDRPGNKRRNADGQTGQGHPLYGQFPCTVLLRDGLLHQEASCSMPGLNSEFELRARAAGMGSADQRAVERHRELSLGKESVSA